METMNDVLAFINKAIDNNYKLEAYSGVSSDDCIKIFGENNIRVQFNLLSEEETLVVSVNDRDLYFNNSICINDLTDEEILSFKLITVKAKKYSDYLTKKYLNNFFRNDEGDTRPKDINDLDNEDD